MTHERSLGAENDPFPDFGLSKMGDDRLREECGVFGVFGHPDAAAITALGLHALQHRGQDSTGIATAETSGVFHVHKERGQVREDGMVARRRTCTRPPLTRRLRCSGG